MSRGALMGVPMEKITVRPVILSDNEYRMYYAAYQNDIQTLKGLQDLINDYNIQDSEGRTILAVAASEGNFDVVKYLVSKGAL
jgi:ankyrin repeat protein